VVYVSYLTLPYLNAFFFSFSIFPHARCKSEFVPSENRACGFERSNTVNLTAATGIIDHGAYDRNFCANSEQKSCFLRKTEGFHPGKSHGNVKSRSHLKHEYMIHAVSGHRKL